MGEEKSRNEMKHCAAMWQLCASSGELGLPTVLVQASGASLLAGVVLVSPGGISSLFQQCL